MKNSLLVRHLERKRPAQNGPVAADADEMSLVGADLETSYGAAVSNADVRLFSFVIQPHLEEGKKKDVLDLQQEIIQNAIVFFLLLLFTLFSCFTEP